MRYDNLFPTLIQITDNIVDVSWRGHMINDINSKRISSPKKNWQSEPNLNEQDVYSKLIDKIATHTAQYLEEMKYKYEGFKITGMWANVLDRNEFHRPHNHSNNMLSGVYYLKSRKEHPGIVFQDPRTQVDILVPEIREYNKTNSSIWSYDCIEDRMIIFPAWLKHYVPVNETDDERVSISWNIMFDGKLGCSEDLSSARF
jgi:uncharacterized protein (TIGR02466 family)